MEDFIEKHDMLNSSQYGFRKANATHHAIIDIVEAIQTNMDHCLFTCGIFVDLKKAFDTVNHKILNNRELKIETFSGRRRPDWQSKPGTEVAVASLQNSNIKIAVNSGGRHLGRLPKTKIWLRTKN